MNTNITGIYWLHFLENSGSTHFAIVPFDIILSVYSLCVKCVALALVRLLPASEPFPGVSLGPQDSSSSTQLSFSFKEVITRFGSMAFVYRLLGGRNHSHIISTSLLLDGTLNIRSYLNELHWDSFKNMRKNMRNITLEFVLMH